jgi:two-component sensor histidine kinase
MCTDGHKARLEVEDDGIGFTEAAPQGTGLGTQVMEALAHGLDGQLEMVTQERGTRAVLHFSVTCQPD